jgi:type I restriction enzyme R subunit
LKPSAISSPTAPPRQIEFIDLVIEQLTEQSAMDPGLLYESPFTDLAPHGPEQVFAITTTRRLVEAIESFNTTASAS